MVLPWPNHYGRLDFRDCPRYKESKPVELSVKCESQVDGFLEDCFTGIEQLFMYESVTIHNCYIHDLALMDLRNMKLSQEQG